MLKNKPTPDVGSSTLKNTNFYRLEKKKKELKTTCFSLMEIKYYDHFPSKMG